MRILNTKYGKYLLCIPAISGFSLTVYYAYKALFKHSEEELERIGEDRTYIAYKRTNGKLRETRGSTHADHHNFVIFLLIVLTIALIYGYSSASQLIDFLITSPFILILPLCIAGTATIIGHKRIRDFREETVELQDGSTIVKETELEIFPLLVLTTIISPGTLYYLDLVKYRGPSSEIAYYLGYIPLGLFVAFGVVLPLVLSAYNIIDYYRSMSAKSSKLINPVIISLLIGLVVSFGIYQSNTSYFEGTKLRSIYNHVYTTTVLPAFQTINDFYMDKIAR